MKNAKKHTIAFSAPFTPSSDAALLIAIVGTDEMARQAAHEIFNNPYFSLTYGFDSAIITDEDGNWEIHYAQL